ncbi:FAD-dependent oxidoreductase [Streptomyces sp. NPDC059256]|uniref:FAD-dependent oxidoreductase n=1 Tax=Streptomyces sp. NPDC059256 TaxID=3346794 RepID=UPI0036A47A21
MSDSSAPTSNAIVIGAGVSGLLAAHVLADIADVTLIERDTLPNGPHPRRGIPQARHAHMVWSGGVKALEELLPGIVDDLTGQGARLVPIMSGLVSKAPSGQWFRRFNGSHHHNLVCSRDLLDSVIRERVLPHPRITLRKDTAVDELTGTADRVDGVRIRHHATEAVLKADLVVDATGRGSHAPVWLQTLGLLPVLERVVDAGVTYATRIYSTPDGAADFPLVNVQASPAQAPGRGGIILPIERGRWLVTLAGSRGGEPTTSGEDFVAFARGLDHPIIGDLIAKAEPLGDVTTSRSTANRRRYYEKARHWPEGFAVIGDSVAGYNPVYGHGLTVAAQTAVALRATIHRHSITTPGTARRIQRAAAGPVHTAWSLAVGQDIFYPGASDTPPTAFERALAKFIDRAVDTGSRNPRALRALLDVMSMERPPARLFAPDMLLTMAVGRKLPHLADPPLSPAEQAFIDR